VLVAVAGQVTFPVVVGIAKAPESHCITNPGTEPLVSARKAARLAFPLALFKLTKTIEAKIPIIAITIKSSIKVKPFFMLFIKIHLLSFYFLFSYPY
jgi:hypothetical protein